MWEVSVATLPAAITNDALTLLNQDLDTLLTSGTRISTTSIGSGQLLIVFSNILSDDDIRIFNTVVNTRFVIPPTFSRVRGYSTGKLTIKNTSYTVLDKVIFQGMSPLRFSVNSYTTTSNTNYSVRFVNSKTKEVISEATFNNTTTDDVMSTGIYTGTTTANTPIVVEIQGKIANASAKAYIDSIVVDYN